MYRTTLSFALLLLSACEPQVVTDYRATVDAMRGLVEDHPGVQERRREFAAEVRAARDLAAAGL